MIGSDIDKHNSVPAPIEPPEALSAPNVHPKPGTGPLASHSGNAPTTTGDHKPEPQAIEDLSSTVKKTPNANTPSKLEPKHYSKQDKATQHITQHTAHSKHSSGFIIHQRIGKGSFATVYKGEWGGDLFPYVRSLENAEKTGTETQAVAIKVVHLSRLRRDRRLMDIFEGEMAILKQMKHPHVVQLLDVIQTSADYNLIMEYCSMGDLSRFIRWRKKLVKHNADAALLLERYPPKPAIDGGSTSGIHSTIARHILAQLSSAIAFLRENHLVHRDLKPQNLLLKPPMASQVEADAMGYIGRFDLPIVKVADFGFARFLPAASMAETMCGSPLYMAPEILNREKYNATADLWSVGTVAYEMITGKPPFPAANPMELMKMIDENNSNVQLPPDTPLDLAYLVKRLLVKSPSERMNFEQFFALTALWAENPELEFDPNNINTSTSSETSQIVEETPESPLSYMDYLRQQGASDIAVQSPSPSPEASLSHSHLIPRTESQVSTKQHDHQHSDNGRQQTNGDSEFYVVIEKRTVEVNSLADDVQSPITAQRRLTNPDKQVRRRRLSSIAYGASPTNALAQALLKSSVRLFGNGNGKDGSTSACNSARVSRDSSLEPLSQRLNSSSLSPDVYASISSMLTPLNGNDKQVINELEQLATIGKVVSLYADIKFSQLDLSSDFSVSGDQRSNSYHHNYYLDGSMHSSDASGKRKSAAFPVQSPSQIDPYLQLRLATEALALHLKSLSILSNAMDCVSDWLEQERVSQSKGRKKDINLSRSTPGINSLVQWVRDKFNECMDKAEIERLAVAKLKKETGSSVPDVNAERLLFDRGIEVAKTAAQQEFSNASSIDMGSKRDEIGTAEMNYGTAVWMLKALLVSDREGNELSEEDREMVEKMMVKIVDRLATVRAKHLKGSQRSYQSLAMSPQSTHNSLSPRDMSRFTPP